MVTITTSTLPAARIPSVRKETAESKKYVRGEAVLHDLEPGYQSGKMTGISVPSRHSSAMNWALARYPSASLPRPDELPGA
jgi:hypothetical protein